METYLVTVEGVKKGKHGVYTFELEANCEEQIPALLSCFSSVDKIETTNINNMRKIQINTMRCFRDAFC